MDMMDALDSRALRFTDCYGQRFMRPGTFRYHVLPIGGHLLVDERPYAVEVVERTTQTTMTQHTVTASPNRGFFGVEQTPLRVEVGDLVLWHCPDPTAPAWAVTGERQKDAEFFRSTRLTNECGYSHAFGLPGDYHWVDANGSRVNGLIRVRDPKCQNERDIERWREHLSKATLVTITDGKVEPIEVEVVVGQTVFFTVVKAPGITITDRRLIGGGETTDDKPKRRRLS